MHRGVIKEYNIKDTIVALATFPSPAALGVVKISGKRALPIIANIFLPNKNTNIEEAKGYTLHYGWIVAGKRRVVSRRALGEFVDEVLVSVMRAPCSYTREDVVEISSHGGIVVMNKIIELAVQAGARLALPGEFTYRAFINGRVDLLKAQSILDIIEARSQEGLSRAVSQLRGNVSVTIKDLKERVKALFAFTEAHINFPEDDVAMPGKEIKLELGVLCKAVEKLVSGSQRAIALREGVKCVICGRANVGKSTLFNRLLKEERVIVSEYAGTTRDVVEEAITMRGVTLRIYDTAGIIDSKDLVTQKAVARSRGAIDDADVVLAVIDASQRVHEQDRALLEMVRGKKVIVILNKSDLPLKVKYCDLGPAARSMLKVRLSALCNRGLSMLEDAVYNSVYNQGVQRHDAVFLSQYQRQVLNEIYQNLCQAKDFFEKEYTIDFVNGALKDCVLSLEKMTGERCSEEVLQSIFSQFCIGK